MVPWHRGWLVTQSSGNTYETREASPAGEYNEDQLLGVGQITNREELEVKFQIERKRQKNRVLAYCLVVAVLALLCAVVAFRWAWSSWDMQEEWISYERANSMIPQAIYKPVEQHVLYIGILSAPGNFHQRDVARKTWVNDALNRFQGRVQIQFIIGQGPLKDDKLSEAPAGEQDWESRWHEMASQEIKGELEAKLKEEADAYRDISRIPAVETVLFDADKVLWLISNAVSWRARFVMKTKDTQRVAVEEVLLAVQDRLPMAQPLYFGKDTLKLTQSDECYGISGDLAHRIMVTYTDNSMSMNLQGSWRDDVSLERWLQAEDGIRNQAQVLPVKRSAMPNLCVQNY